MECIFDNGMLKVNTQRGDIIVNIEENGCDLGIRVDLITPKAIGFQEERISLASVKLNSAEGVVRTMVFGDGDKENATDIIEHKNVYKDFDISFSLKEVKVNSEIYNVVVTRGDNKISFTYELGKGYGGMTRDIILGSILSSYPASIKECTEDADIVRNAELSCEKIRRDIEELQKDAEKEDSIFI